MTMGSNESPRVKLALERAGLHGPPSSIPHFTQTLLMPTGLTIEEDEDGEEYFSWQKLEFKEITQTEAFNCVWDFVDLVDAESQAIGEFLKRWGLPYWPEDGPDSYQDYPEGYREAAQQARSTLLLVAATEVGELVDPSVLEDLEHWDDFEPEVDFGPFASGADFQEKWLEREEEKEKLRRTHWDEERRAGRGLRMQRKLVSNIFNGVENSEWAWPMVESLHFSVHWDEAGRRVNIGSSGVVRIVGSYIVGLLSGPTLDVFVCSVCGSPYPFSEATGGRRPAIGKRRFCSPACRLEARRTDNLASWHKNKLKWRGD